LSLICISLLPPMKWFSGLALGNYAVMYGGGFLLAPVDFEFSVFRWRFWFLITPRDFLTLAARNPPPPFPHSPPPFNLFFLSPYTFCPVLCFSCLFVRPPVRRLPKPPFPDVPERDPMTSPPKGSFIFQGSRRYPLGPGFCPHEFPSARVLSFLLCLHGKPRLPRRNKDHPPAVVFDPLSARVPGLVLKAFQCLPSRCFGADLSALPIS